MDVEAVAGAGWGLAIGLAVALTVALLALRALWKRAKGDPQPPAQGEYTDTTSTPFPNFGSKRA